MNRFLATLALAAGILAAPAAQSATLTDDPAALALFTAAPEGARFRSQNTGNEIYVGSGDLGVGANRSEAGFVYAATQTFTVAYNAATGVVTATLGSTTASWTTAAGQMFNALRVAITGPNTGGGAQNGTTLSMTGVSVNGSPVGDIVGATTAPRLTTDWLVSGFAQLAGNVTMTGTLNYFGPIGTNISSEAARIDVTFGTVPTPAPIPLPAAGWLLLAGLGALGAAARRKRSA